MKYNLADMYRIYVTDCEERGEEPRDYKTYKQVIYDHNELMINTLLQGGVYSFGMGLGFFGVKYCKRKFEYDEHGGIKNLKPDFAATKKLREKGDMTTVVYHTDPFFYMWQWFGCVIEKQSLWTIEGTIGPLGIGRKIKKHVDANPLAKEFYIKDF